MIGGLAVAAGALAAIVGAELVARRALLAYGGYYRYVPHRRQRLHIDRTAVPALEPIANVHINADGERGGPAPRKGEPVWRALLVGGSAAECYFLDQSRTWAAVTERALNRPEALRRLGAPRAHIGSIARAIVPCEGIFHMLERVLPRYERLDAILVMVGASDAVAWLEKKMPPVLEDGSVDLDKLFEIHPEVAWSWSPRRTALYRIASGLDRRLRKPLLEHDNACSWLHRLRKMRSEALRYHDEVPDPSPMLDYLDRHLRAMIRLGREHASRVIIVRQPWFDKDHTPEEQAIFWNFGLGRPYKETVTEYLTPAAVRRLLRLVDTRIASIADELGVEQIDLMPRLEKSTRTFYDFLHVTPSGAEVVGAAVAEAILTPAARVSEVQPRRSNSVAPRAPAVQDEAASVPRITMGPQAAPNPSPAKPGLINRA